jgi:DNA-binding transcriptional LysR family regulator
MLTGLRVVLEVARTGSFSATAERLGYTQSAVSRQVAVTEKAACVARVVRPPRGAPPTPAGEALARHAGKVLDEVAGSRYSSPKPPPRRSWRRCAAGESKSPSSRPRGPLDPRRLIVSLAAQTRRSACLPPYA